MQTIGPKEERSLKDDLFELANRIESRLVLPPELPGDSETAIPILRELYNDDVAKISLILSHFWPEEYLFIRVASLNRELFAGFEFFAEVEPLFDFSFSTLRKNAFDDYLVLNDALWEFGDLNFVEESGIRDRIHVLIYAILPWLFVETSDYSRYWICSTSRDVQSYDESVEWSGRKEMNVGDLVFMYQTAPAKAIQTLYVVDDWPIMDPWGAWDGIWVSLKKLAEIPPIEFSWMRTDEVLKDWSVIRQQFQGVKTEPVPHACYNELISKIPNSICQELDLTPEPVAHVAHSGEFATEAEFEEKIVDPLLRGWGLNFLRQYPLKCYFGTQKITGYVDYLIQYDGRPVAVVENKLRIVNDVQLAAAVNQARSYALMLGVQCFVVGAPEGLKLYQLKGTVEEVVSEWSLGSKSQEETFREKLLSCAGIKPT
ncbi:hypothetical protein C5Y96_26925 [Blastopirellula marina]|uniref:Type I restriction enzyme R protein N-terminal domain-containing protein n=2 Tax=Pirellulales TaxID=2691354 RepID=A0A2S8EYY4_9BACT|nr:hypothetical protein C5Y96_26925 [Blastopirellula marina]RCS40986.1 hypothetical protein DTL36_26970 [Bremerella cremea]